jgi:transglutaminase-like putative cysteine protease
VRLLKVTRLPKNKDAQVDVTVREMIRICRGEVWSPKVRWLLHHVSLPHYSKRETAAKLTDFIRSKFPFELDPEDVELIRTPSYYARTYREGKPASGDCDDFALLLATLLGSLGVDALGFVVMARHPGPREPFGHVFVAARIAGHDGYYDPSVSQTYNTHGLRRKVYPVPMENFPPAIV